MINNYVSWIVSCFLILAGADLIGGQKDMKAKDYYEGPTPYVFEMHKLYKDVSSFAHDQYGFSMSGAGGQMMNGIHGIEFSFEVKHEMTEKSVIDALQAIRSFTVEAGNKNSIITEACDEGKVLPRMVRLFLVIRSKNPDLQFNTAYLSKDKVTFRLRKENQIRSEVVKETFLE